MKRFKLTSQVLGHFSQNNSTLISPAVVCRVTDIKQFVKEEESLLRGEFERKDLGFRFKIFLWTFALFGWIFKGNHWQQQTLFFYQYHNFR